MRKTLWVNVARGLVLGGAAWALYGFYRRVYGVFTAAFLGCALRFDDAIVSFAGLWAFCFCAFWLFFFWLL